MTKTRSRRLCLIAALLIACGCEGQVTSEPGGNAAPEIRKKAEAYSVAYWADSAAGNFYALVDRAPIRVCVELMPGTSLPQWFVQLNVAAATQEWVAAVQPNSSAQLHATVDFTCDRLVADNIPLYDMTVILYPGAGRAWAHGDTVDLYEGEALFYETVLHEMGHFFGMGDTYDEANGGCLPHQPPSVMCDAAFTTLQEDDIRGARQAFRLVHPDLYSGPRPIAARDSGRCVDVIGFGTANGTGTQIWDCPFPTFNQVWAYDSNARTFVGEQSGKCLEIAGWGTDNGTPVQIWDCHGGANQQWELWADGTIRSLYTGQCLEVASFGTENGSALQTWDCHGGSNQLWWWY